MSNGELVDELQGLNLYISEWVNETKFYTRWVEPSDRCLAVDLFDDTADLATMFALDIVIEVERR